MSCSNHPQWYHDSEDCPFCVRTKMMTQQEAIDILERILGRELQEFNECTGNTETCPVEECMLCGIRDCQGNEPLHYHHDGCPYCSEESN